MNDENSVHIVDRHRPRSDRWIAGLAVALIVAGFLLVYRNIPPYSWWQLKLGIYPYARDKKAVARGEELYESRCRGCHDKGFVLFLRQHDEHHFMATDYYQAITNGVSSRMPGFNKTLTSDERWKIVSYILNRAPGPDRPRK